MKALPTDNFTKEPGTEPRTATIIKPKEMTALPTTKPETATLIKGKELPVLPTVTMVNGTADDRGNKPKIDYSGKLTDNGPSNYAPYVAAAVLKNCALMPENSEIISHISEALSTGTKMIKYHLQIKQPERQFNGLNESSLYKPFFWVRSTGRHGTGLLLLRPEYDVLSLTSLELGVVTMHVNLIEEPSNCLNQLSYTDIEVLIRELVMNDFQNTSSGELVKLKPTDSVCNMHIRNESGVADFRYMCCQRSETHHISCEFLHSDTWLNILLVVITILKVLVILFSPRLVPDTFYRLKHVAAPYIHRLQEPLTIKAVLTTRPDIFLNVKNKFKLKKFREMNKFKTTLQNMACDVPYDLRVNQLHLRVKTGRLLPEDFAPVGLLQTLYQSFFKCKIRERPSVNDCCNADFFLFSKCHKKRVSWYTVLKRLMAALLLVVLAIPWIMRIYVYFQFEHEEMHMRKEIASGKSLRFYFPGNFTLLLTPLHVLFIFIYILLSFESCIFGVMSKKMKEQFKFVLRKCFQDMREMNQMDVIGWVIRVSVKPCTMFGGIGICIGLVTWTVCLPVLLLILSFYIFPTLNITLRLLAHFAVYLFPKNACTKSSVFSGISRILDKLAKNFEMENISQKETLEKKDSVLKSGWKRVQQLVVIILCLISMYSLIFLMVEFVSFLVEIFVYTLMGLILNASMTLTYISLSFLLGVYGNDCFGFVSKRFLSFNRTMNECIVELGKDKIENEIYSDDEKQENIAFRVKTKRAEVDDNPVKLVSSMDLLPRWQVSRLVLFLSKYDRPMIPKSFYFKSCKMPFYSVPGELLINYFWAAAEFGLILLFLMFVLVVVLAFGDTYEISATNKMLATIAGGFVPFMLRNIVFKKHSVPVVDKSNMHFQVCLHNLLEDHLQTWPIYDIDVIKRVRSQYSALTHHADPESEDVDEKETPVFEDAKPFINNGGTTIDHAIDLLIYIDEKIDSEDFPGMVINGRDRAYNGSTSLLDDIEPDEKEMKEIIYRK